MRNIFRIIGVSLVSMAGILLVSGVAWGQALKTPIEGTRRYCRSLGAPDREWVDEDGIEHVRGLNGQCGHIGSDVWGRTPGERWVANWDQDFDAGTYFEHGTVVFSGLILDEPALATGHYTSECTRSEHVWTCLEEHVWHLGDGRLLKFSGTYQRDLAMRYTGFLLDPPGGESRQGPRQRR